MTRSDLAGLDADALSVIDGARGMHDPTPEVQARVRGKLELSLAAGATVAWYGAAASAMGTKLIAAAVTVGLAGTGLWYAEHRHALHAQSVAESTPPRPAFEVNLHAAEPTQDDAEPGNPNAEEPRTPDSSAGRLPQRAAVSNAGRIGDLAAETQALVQVNTAINHHDGAGALALLDDYDRRFKSKILFAERSAARVFALCSLGRLDAARAEARHFLRRFPRSPLVARIHASCAEPSLTRPTAP
jgi:hypothetical protein